MVYHFRGFEGLESVVNFYLSGSESEWYGIAYWTFGAYGAGETLRPYIETWGRVSRSKKGLEVP
jgi:hypothetical protein